MDSTSTTLRCYDVAVCGGGIAGIAAALAAAREGKRTLLIERHYLLGGLATAGLVTIYLPLCDGLGRQVSFGIAEELLRLSVLHGREGGERFAARNWLDDVGGRGASDPRFEVQFNPQIFAILAEQLLRREGVDILYGSYVTDAHTEGGRLRSVDVHNKSGCVRYAVGAAVDATGDADLAVLCGLPTETFRQGNVLAAWYYRTGRAGYELVQHGCCDVPDEEREGRAVEQLVPRRFGGLDAEELSEMTCLSHGEILRHFLAHRATDPAATLSTVPTTPQIRMTRRIVGACTLKHTEEHVLAPDSIGMVSNWKRRGPVWEVPFGTLYAEAIGNLFFAGRCTSVNEVLWDVMRVIPCCAVTGQAAGTAAALASDGSTPDAQQVQARLRAAGVVLHEHELF